MELRIGTCGWAFKDWKGAFYPPGTKDELVTSFMGVPSSGPRQSRLLLA
jgi:uncharacterized protein YecE (DUF72 family)